MGPITRYYPTQFLRYIYFTILIFTITRPLNIDINQYQNTANLQYPLYDILLNLLTMIFAISLNFISTIVETILFEPVQNKLSR